MNAEKYTYNGESMDEYTATQKQRHIERQIRRWKREEAGMAAAGMPTDEAKAKVARWQETQRDFIRQTGLKRQYDREQIGKAVVKAGNGDIIKVHRTLPTAQPNVITQVNSAKGGISRNYYDSDGRWEKQITNNNHGNPKYHPFGSHGEHAHDIIWEDGKIVGRPKRELTEAERKEIGDIL
jgi:hypothetical protein